jgi:hypothetical protein
MCKKYAEIRRLEIKYIHLRKSNAKTFGMMDYLKLFWVFVRAQFCRIFFKRLNVSFKKVYGNWYCDIKGWPEKYFPNSLMVGDASRLITLMSGGADYVTFDVVPSKKELSEEGLVRLNLTSSSVTGGGYYETEVGGIKLPCVWLCPVTLFVLGRYPKYIYFKY